ncbi:MAG: hypothetical protein ACRECX_09710 [Methyloceanibacter sp.]|uniref:hypothetical protein n=1 Tax=Methyloceanibacter sp. TaxID=1965321 RepID=UPI003D6CF413
MDDDQIMNADQLKLAIDDARHRQIALLDLIYSTDTKALGLLRLHVTIGMAAAAGAVAGFTSTSSIPKSVAVGLIAAVVALFVGCVFCFRSMRSAKVSLPGRGADFWKAALDNKVTVPVIADQYLSELANGQERDRETNRVTARDFAIAKWAGIVSPALALVTGLLSLLISC